MTTVSIRDLARNASRVVRDVARTGRPALVTRHGKPMVAVVPIDQTEVDDFILSASPALAADLAAAEKALAAGKTPAADEIFDELEAKRGRSNRATHR
jgi:prevent-host-death family protein